MKLYVKNFSSFRDDLQKVDLKKELKQKYKFDTRRQDKFIHLGVYGAQLLKDKTKIRVDDELYVTSGVGNINIVQKTNTYMYEENQPLKIFDFINLLGNTTSYYIAKSLGVKGKNIFQISDNFTYIRTLISIYSSLKNSGKNAIICAIDLVSNPEEIIKRVLGIDEKTEVVSAVNYQKLSLNPSGAIAVIEFETKIYTLNEIKEIIKQSDDKIVISPRCMELKHNEYEKFFETMASCEINTAIKNQEDMQYVDCFENRYKIIKLKNIK
ncbi:MAG: hypothetical protein GXP61_07105 [Epsilonproteobacteria bacterium]|nr:hypothetical protein [Campylobacterota bacterium]